MLYCRLMTVDAFCFVCCSFCLCHYSTSTLVIILSIFWAPKGQRIFFETAFLFPWFELLFSLNRWICSPKLHFLKPLTRAAEDHVLTNPGIIIYALAFQKCPESLYWLTLLYSAMIVSVPSVTTSQNWSITTSPYIDKDLQKNDPQLYWFTMKICYY